MKQSDLIKLAEIAGRKVLDLTENRWTMPDDIHVQSDIFPRCGVKWKPYGDLNQAFECLKGMDCLYKIEYLDLGTYSITIGEADLFTHDYTLSEAICKVILEATK